MKRKTLPKKTQSEVADALVSTILSFRSKPLRPDNSNVQDRMLGLVKAVTTMRGASLQEPLIHQNAGLLVSQPFNMVDAQELKVHNDTHAACIRLKHRSLVGLGLKDKAFSRQLNKLCRFGNAKNFRSLLSLVAQDYVDTFNGYIEVVRQGVGGPIIGLHHIPAPNVEIMSFSQTGLLAYQQRAGIVLSGGRRQSESSVRIMAEFGRSEELRKAEPRHFEKTKDGRIAEVIHIKGNSNMSRYYGVPDWLAVVSSCELAGAVKQHVFDFFCNRGVPAMLLFITGGYMSPDTWKEITDRLQENVGEGNAYRTNAFHISDPDSKVTAQQLSPNNTDNGTFFRDMQEALGSLIVSAHGVPPLLAGIQLPGKIQGANDLPNAVIAFQTLENGPVQMDFEERLWETLGDPEINGGLKVPKASEDSEGPFELIPLTVEMAKAMKLLAPAQTLGKAKENLADQAQGERDLSEGVKK